MMCLPKQQKKWTGFAGECKKKILVVDCYDGDTITVVIPLGYRTHYEFSCRLYGIDTPEIRTHDAMEKKKGLEAKLYLTNLIKNKKVTLQFANAQDKFGRLLATVYLGHMNVNQHMIDQGYARAYHGEKKKQMEEKV